jgi:ABC-type Fe3+/spermidine/putrescine transport system ATPase subunit
MSDRLAVMNAGRIVQIGTPRQVYEEPADTYVADFLGAANLMEIEVLTAGTEGALRLGDWTLTSRRCEATATGPAHAVIRPERVRIEEHGSATARQRLRHRLGVVATLGAGQRELAGLASLASAMRERIMVLWPGVRELPVADADPVDVYQRADGGPLA